MALFNIETYDPSEVAINISGTPITGLSGDTFLTLERIHQPVETIIGVAGEVCVTVSPSTSGRFTITLRQTAASNHYLTMLHNQQFEASKLGSIPVFNIVIEDFSESVKVLASNCYVENYPSIALGRSQNDKEWTFFCSSLEYQYNKLKTPATVIEL